MEAYKTAVAAAASELGVEADKLESVLKSKLSKYLNIPEEEAEAEGEGEGGEFDAEAIAKQSRANR